MRLLIAGGGTGGHIYPALAVARSLRDRPNAPELVWLGGHRGLESSLVRAERIRVRRLVLRSLRSVDMSVHTVLDPLRLAASVPQAAAILARERPAAIFTTRGHVIHVSGDDGYAEALASRGRLPAEQQSRYRPYPFLRTDMLAALVAADLVVGRAGSSTLAEVTALGIPSVIVPYPHAAGHQVANARVLAGSGAARLVADEDFDADALVAVADLLGDEGTLAAMSVAARSFGRPRAADDVAELVLAAAERR